ncbi:hypothetical protein [Candidatus Electrothrix sp.]|uniref:hypothetical protein n=1 Tax=Candidatus Electrothrix sp. TaxID=2170559 RepID=UPI004055F3F4
MSTVEIKYISINITPEVGANDWVVAVRVVPAGRDGTTVYGRTLMPGEEDSGVPISYNPSAGEKIEFRPGDLKFTIYDIDRIAEVDSNGYAPVTYTIQTWLKFCAPVDQNLFLFLVAASKRLDTAYFAYSQITSIAKDISGSFPHQCQQIITVLGLSEFLCIALNRAVNMLQQLSGNFSINLQLPNSITGNVQSLREIRNAFEHIEDRALGKVRNKIHPDAFTIFDQKKIFTEGILTYGKHSLTLHTDILQMLLDARQTLLKIAISISGGDTIPFDVNQMNYSKHK